MIDLHAWFRFQNFGDAAGGAGQVHHRVRWAGVWCHVAVAAGAAVTAGHPLIPKIPDDVGDYCPISLVHYPPKLFSKLLADRVRSRLGGLVIINLSTCFRSRLGMEMLPTLEG